MTRDQVVAKSRELMTPVLGAAAGRVIERTLDIDKMGNIREFRPLLRRN
jgi:hypothetical protein